MNRSLWLIFAALILIASGVLVQYHPHGRAGAAPDERQLPDVRIQHEFVRVASGGGVSAGTTPDRRAAEMRSSPTPDSWDPIVVERRPPAAIEIAPASHSSATSAPPRTPVARRATNQDRTLFEKARRAFVGDGRYRPQPFPTVRDNN